MLTKDELKEYEKVVGFNLWQIEKDYLQHILLLFLYQRVKRELIFKGGTALQKVFGLNRFSLDMDFTYTKNEVQKILEKVIKDITNFGFPSNLGRMEKSKISETFPVKIKGPLFDGSEKTISSLRIEISLREDIVLEPMVKEVVPVYSDLRPYTVIVMSLEEILAEKIRAIIWRAKPRDLYDLWFLLRKNVKFDIELINKKLNYYNLKFDKKKFFKNIRSFKGRWEKELKPLVSGLPSFKVVEEEVRLLLKNDF